MSTKRKPISHLVKPHITPLAVETFRAMQATVCRCRSARWRPNSPGEFTTSGGSWVKTECRGCRNGRLHSVLHTEMGYRPWQWPCVEHPHENANPDCVALFRELEAAARGDPSPWEQRAKRISDLEGEAP